MEEKIRYSENLDNIRKALRLFQSHKEIITFNSQKGYTQEKGVSFHLQMEFEIPDDIPTGFEKSFSAYQDSSLISTSPLSNSSYLYNGNDKKVTSSGTSSSQKTSTTSTGITTSTTTSTGSVKNLPQCFRNNSNYQALDTLHTPPICSDNVEIGIVIRTYKQNKKYEGDVEKVDIELNPKTTTLKDIIQTLIPHKEPKKVVEDGVYFTKKDIVIGKDLDKDHKWMACYPCELNYTLYNIYGEGKEKDFKMTFLLDDIK
uniref:Uncharacterized protein n=1 Tax=Parastrongyloides trichosuri TaxID=131310 RepID=A0A0N5A5D8_PARTI